MCLTPQSTSVAPDGTAPCVVLRGTITIPVPEGDVHRVVSRCVPSSITSRHLLLVACCLPTAYVMSPPLSLSILGSRTSDLNELVDTGKFRKNEAAAAAAAAAL
jgi:hypothetical protein